jgi:flavin-dependent dehydrogenase
MKLTKRERKYRQKIICEHKYNKENQKILDVYVKKSRWWNTYYKLYKSITGFVFITRVINDKEESERAFKSLKEFLMPIKDD